MNRGASQLDEWLATHEPRLKNTSYNRYAGTLKQLFEVAVNDRIIAESPFDRVLTRWKRPQGVQRRIPTLKQFAQIVEEVRTEVCSPWAKASGDFIEFLGLAGVRQAEAASLTWGAVNFDTERISFRRHKTDRPFTVPIYPHLRPLTARSRGRRRSLTAGLQVQGCQEGAGWGMLPARSSSLRAISGAISGCRRSRD